MAGFGVMPQLAGVDVRQLTPEQKQALLQMIQQRGQQPQRFQDPVANYLNQSAQRMKTGFEELTGPPPAGAPTAASPAWWNQKAQGASDVLRGSMPYLAPLALPAAAEAPAGALLGLGIGTGAAAGTEELGKKAGVAPGMAALAGDVAGIGLGGAASKIGAEDLMAAGRAFDRLNAGSDERGSISFKWKPGMKLSEIPENVQLPKAGARITVPEVMRHLEERTQKTLGEVPADASPRVKLNRILKLGAPELEDQMAQPDPRLDFYTKDTAAADADIQRAYPELAQDPNKLTLQKAISAAVSKSSNPREEAFTGGRIWGGYRNTGRIPIKQPSGLNWPSQGAQVALTAMQKYLDMLGEEGLARLLTSKAKVGELRKLNPNVEGKANDVVPGSLILGPKVGRYFMDIMGMPHEGSTVDMWDVRANQRRLGTMFRGDKPIEAPLTEGDRQIYMELHRILAEKYGLKNRNEAQSGLWHYEKNLYRKLGIPDKPYMRSEGTQKLLESMGEGEKSR